MQARDTRPTPQRCHHALMYLTNAENHLQCHYRTEALKLSTNRNSCLEMRKLVQEVVNHRTWMTIPWYQRIPLRIQMSLLSRQATFEQAGSKARALLEETALITNASTYVPVMIMDIVEGIEAIAYREYASTVCSNLRHYFTYKEHWVNLQFWTQVCDLEYMTTETKYSARVFREAFTLRFHKLVELAREQLEPQSESVPQTRSN